MARTPTHDTFLPWIESVFYATFHAKRGPQIVYQVPEGLISQGPSGGSTSTLYGSRNTNIGSSVRVPAETSNGATPCGSVSSPTTMPQSSLLTSISTCDGTKADPSVSAHRSSNSTSTLDTASSSSSASHLPNQQNGFLQPSSSISPQRSLALQTESFPAPLLDFHDISRFVIPPQDMCGRLVVCTTRTHSVIGFPVCLEGEKYERVHFRYNFCFVFERTADLSCYEPVVRKIARVLMACEEESSFLSNPNTAPQVYSILEQLYEDLNNYHETSIPIVDQFNSIELKIFPFYPNPQDVYDWTVPLALINLMKRIEPNWDLTMVKVCKYIDGVNHVSRIANLADCDLELTRQAISHLLYYQCIMTIDIFQYSNIYTLERSLQWLADDPNVNEECGPYVTRPGYEIQDWPQLLFLYSRLKPGKTVFEWEEEHGVRAQGIDVRRFMSFGVIKGFLRRIHRWPILVPEKPSGTDGERPEVHTTMKISIGRKRGKSLSNTTKPRPHSPDIRRERAHSHSQSQSQSQPLTYPHTRPLTEAEEYARSIQLREDAASNGAGSLGLRPRKSYTNRDIPESWRLPERPGLRHQHSGPTTPRPPSAHLPGHDSQRSQLRRQSPSPSPDRYLDLSVPPYPPELPALLDGSHHTDELAVRFGAGWPTLEKWLVALGEGEGNGDFGRVAIIYR